jgi:hypothetical protein
VGDESTPKVADGPVPSNSQTQGLDVLAVQLYRQIVVCVLLLGAVCCNRWLLQYAVQSVTTLSLGERCSQSERPSEVKLGYL